uniref:Uncharacterized protein n=1 Tax=Anguilla anguilla TaxID=7936 RepID=A0A0E9PQZ8_ANGAN
MSNSIWPRCKMLFMERNGSNKSIIHQLTSRLPPALLFQIYLKTTVSQLTCQCSKPKEYPSIIFRQVGKLYRQWL